MTIPPVQNSLGDSPQQPGRKGRGRRYRNHRHRRGDHKSRPRSNSAESETSMSSDSSTVFNTTHRQSKTHAPKKYNENMFVAMDCEMVGVGPHGKLSSLARVTIIDWNGTVLMDKCVQQEQEVTDYRTFVSGITPEMLCSDLAIDFASCRRLVLALLEGKILVGHGLKNDLRVLGITHPWHMVRDTAKYEAFMKVRFEDGVLWPRGLRDLCKEKLDKEVQTAGKPHCPYEDAMAAMDLYRLVQNKWEKAMEYKVNKTRAIQQQQQHLQLAAATE